MREKRRVPYRVYLSEQELPTSWYNIQADSAHTFKAGIESGNKKPVTPGDLSSIFPKDLILQEVTTERFIDIPEEVQELYKSFRPSPYAGRTAWSRNWIPPARIYYKYEV